MAKREPVPVDFEVLLGCSTSDTYQEPIPHFKLTADEIQRKMLDILKRQRGR